MQKNANYSEIDSFTVEDVLLAVTQRAGTEHRSFRLQKQYEQDGEVKHTAYLSHRHVPALVTLALRYLKEYGDYNKLRVLQQIRVDVNTTIDRYEKEIEQERQ